MTYTAIDCQSFAGGFALGVVQAGFELIGKREYPGGFGAPAMEANRHLLGYNWKLEDSDPAAWTPLEADLVFGNPPCSGFSQRSSMVFGNMPDGTKGRLEFRGIDSKANDCMHALIEYAAKCNPKIVIFESVQGAFKAGRPLMQELRAKLDNLTGHSFTLYHVLHNVKDLSGAQNRPRYFWIAARIPFGVLPQFSPEVTVSDRIADLTDTELGSIEGHVIDNTAQEQRIYELAQTGLWKENETSGEAYARISSLGITLPSWNGPYVTDKGTTQFAPRRLIWNKPSRVLTGDAPWKIVHPALPRTLTHREIARLSGFPDSWLCAPYMVKRKNNYWWGKGITVEAGNWIASAAADALAGHEAPYWGEPIGDREYLIDATDQEAFNNADISLFDEEIA